MAYSKTRKHYRAASKKTGCACNEEADFVVEIKQVRGVLLAVFSLVIIIFLKGLLIGYSLKSLSKE